MMRSCAVAVLCLAVGAVAAPFAAADVLDDALPVEHLLQFRGTLLVGDDGNGALAAQFPTTVDGEAVHYVLLIENGCGGEQPPPCPPAVENLRVTLDGDVVFSDPTPPPLARVPVALNEVGGDPNQIVAVAQGAPHAAARVTVLAVRPLPVVVGGRSVLPLATTLGGVHDLLIVHNAGPANAVYRLEVFNIDGTPAGMTAPRALAAHATVTIDIGEAARAVNPAWVRGPVHVRWAARGLSRVSTVAREIVPALSEAGRPRAAFELALDDYGPFPLNALEARAFGF